MQILFVILELVFAVYGAVDGGSAVAKRFNIPLNIRRRDER
jgi:hypothetical protein